MFAPFSKSVRATGMQSLANKNKTCGSDGSGVAQKLFFHLSVGFDLAQWLREFLRRSSVGSTGRPSKLARVISAGRTSSGHGPWLDCEPSMHRRWGVGQPVLFW